MLPRDVDSVESFDTEHFEAKQARNKKRKQAKKDFNDGGRKIHRVGKKERWHFDKNYDYGMNDD